MLGPGLYKGYIGITGNRMETTGIIGSYWGYIGIMERKMKTIGIVGYIKGL